MKYVIDTTVWAPPPRGHEHVTRVVGGLAFVHVHFHSHGTNGHSAYSVGKGARSPRMTQPSSRVVSEPGDTIRKYGPEYRLRREIEAMVFETSKTSIPIPQVTEIQLDPDADAEHNWVIMKKLPGTQQGQAWPNMTIHARSYTLTQFRAYLQELHSIQPQTPGLIGSCSGGPAYDHRIHNRRTYGPFKSITELHDFLVSPMKNSSCPERTTKYRSLLPDMHGISLTHANLSWENILIQPETGEVTGILDWEMAGFWPDWWEYRKALYGSRPQPWWYEVLKEIMSQYRSESQADMDIEMF